MPWSTSREPGLQQLADLASDLSGDDEPVLSLEFLLGRNDLLHATLPQRPRPQLGETPIFGEGAVVRWVALHDRACDLRVELRPGDSVGERQVQRAIRSLLLYEHVVTPKTRWQARVRLWERDRLESLPPFVEQRRWTQCHCWRCQAGISRPQLSTGQSRAVAQCA
jgi:hypothetical protein